MKNIFLLFLLQLCIWSVVAQNTKIKGQVFDTSTKEKTPLFGATISSLDGVYGAITNENGFFELDIPKTIKKIQVSYIGFNNQEINLNSKTYYEVNLEANVLEEVQFNIKKLDRSFIDPINSQTLDSKELAKAACCNLSESFETNAAVDVSFSDAVTGAKKIRMLGLDGVYTQIMQENQPAIRGLANSFGMLFVPGPFLHSVQINRGAGSVTNGYEAITGQLNYNYKEACSSERFFLNVFGSRHGQFELNTNFSHRFNEKWSTILFVHGMMHEVKHDSNKDGFQDVPLNERVVISNKWKFFSGKVFNTQFGYTFTFDDRESGQLADLHLNEGKTKLFQTTNVNRRYEAFAKTGFVLKNQLQSVGIQYKYFNHQHQAWYGNRFYNANENFANVNFIFQTKMQNNKNEMKLGASYVLDYFKESLDDLDLGRKESVPGFFAEYTYQDYEKMSFIMGLRADFHNIHGVWLSPKANFKYSFPKKFTLKLAAGKGYRTPNVIAENIAVLASSRSIQVVDNNTFESAWNVGGSLIKEFYLGFRQASIVTDFYRTDFTNQLVRDFENAREATFYNLDGKSYANSFQVEAKVEAADRLDLQLAYKFDDVKVNFESGLKLAPYIPRHKMLLTVDYETKNKHWRFNVTNQLNGKSRLPSTAANLETNQRDDFSEVFFNLNSQITYLVKTWEFYLGGENLTNYWQENPIIGADDPFGSNFDASMIWGPLGGTRFYAGLRLTIPYKNKK